jgi:hypothetical protein
MPLSSTHGSTPRASHNTRALLAVPSLRLESLFGHCRTERAPSSPASVQLYHSQFCEAIFESYREQHEFTTLFLSHVDARTKSTLSHRHASGCRNALITIQAQPPGRRSRLIAGVHSNGIGRRLLSLKRGWQAVHPSCVLSLASHVFWCIQAYAVVAEGPSSAAILVCTRSQPYGLCRAEWLGRQALTSHYVGKSCMWLFRRP